MTHFGEGPGVQEQLHELKRRLDEYAQRAREHEQEEFVARVRADVEREAGAELLPEYTQAAPPEQLYLGLERYWKKRMTAERAPVS